MSIRAVLFDLDNTLTHRGRSVAAFSQEPCRLLIKANLTALMWSRLSRL